MNNVVDSGLGIPPLHPVRLPACYAAGCQGGLPSRIIAATLADPRDAVGDINERTQSTLPCLRSGEREGIRVVVMLPGWVVDAVLASRARSTLQILQLTL